jgi:hypothetical protein
MNISKVYMLEVLEGNILYFDKISEFSLPIHNHILLCFYSSKYNAISTETSHEYSESVYMFME